MKLLRLLLAFACFSPLVLTRAATTPAETVKPATAAEIAYWKTLQADIAALRAANAAYPARNFMQFSVVQLNEIMSRIEKFLDARDADPVDGLGEDIQAYRKQLLAMLDNALTPLRLAAKGKGTAAGSANFNPRAAMENMLSANAQFRTVDGYKGELYRMHNAIDRRIVAGGGPRILFFRSLNLGDSAEFEFAASTPAQRDEKFIAASRAIHPALGVMAEKKFIKFRLDGRLDDLILAKRDEFLAEALKLNQQTAKMSEEQLEAQLKNLPADAEPTDRALFEFVIALERQERADPIAKSVMLENWKAVFAQWLGKADESAATDGCNDLAASAAGGWFAFTADGLTVEGRDFKTGKPAFTAVSEFPIRGLAAGADNSLFAFTTGGLLKLVVEPGVTQPKFSAVNKVAYQTLVGAFAAARTRPRYAYAWGAAPAIADDGQESLFKANSSSRITAIGIDSIGRHVAIGYSGRNDTGGGDLRYGFDVLALPETKEDLANLSVESKSFNPAYSVPVNAIAVTDGAKHAAIATGLDAFGTVEIFDLTGKEAQSTQVALDNQAYNYVAFVGSGDALAVLAGTRQGVIRVWSVKTGNLVARYLAPSGPQGVAMAVEGADLITANLGAPGVYRWSAADGKLLATLDGEAPKLDEAKLAAELKAEQGRRPLIGKFDSIRRTEDPKARAQALRAFLASDGPGLEATGLKEWIERSILSARESELGALHNAKKYAEAYKLAKESLAEGLESKDVHFYLLVAAKHSNAPDTDKLHAAALERYPQSGDIAYLNHSWRKDVYARAGNIEAALKEVDEMDQLQPEDAPHASTRQGILFDAADAAYKAGNSRQAIQHYLKSLDYCQTKEDQLNVLPSIFSLTYAVKDWGLCARVASAILELDPAKKNDQQFMAAARYAYQMSQQGKQ